MEEERLQKYLAECGVASRRKCEEYITLRICKSKWRDCNRTWNKNNSRKRHSFIKRKKSRKRK
jgi:16S rRNA U516 pseudouridylate synthase RsuA-like enzyme